MVKTKTTTSVATKIVIATLAVGALAAAAVALKKPTVPCVCSSGYKNCSGTCASLQNDANNCGSCGNKCSSGNICKQGKCLRITCTDSDDGKNFTKKGTVTVTSLEELKASLDDSSQLDEVTQALDAAGISQGTGNKTLVDKCVTSYLNQGTYWSSDKPVLAEFSCNGIKPKVTYHDCSSEKKVCEDGACVLRCSAYQTTCDDKCVSTKIDNDNCGSCGTKCADGTKCTNGSCVSKCGTNQGYCDGKCVNLQSNNKNCGACGNSCASNQSCSKGVCVLGNISCSGQNIVQCDNKCVNIKTDRNNCGSCGKVCASGFSCKSGLCTTSTPVNPL